MAFTLKKAAMSRRLMARTRRIPQIGVIALAMMTRSVLGQEAKPSSDTMRAVPIEQTEADTVFTNYTFRDGEKLPQLRIHYVTLGHKHLNVRGEVDNAILLLHWTNASSQALVTPEFQRALFAPGSPLDVSRYFMIIPDDIGHGRSSKPSNGLKVSFPHYDYGDMVDLQHKLVGESLRIEHLHAVIGMSMGCMNAKRRWVAKHKGPVGTPLRSCRIDLSSSGPWRRGGNYLDACAIEPTNRSPLHQGGCLMSLRALIVDDEPLARTALLRLLKRERDINVVGQCSDGDSAVHAIRQMQPDLVFLDVQMPEMDGFKVVESIGVEEMPVTVFVTAFDRYAIQAFDANAVDYLMKPFAPDRFSRALARARDSCLGRQDREAAKRLFSLLGSRYSADYAQRLTVASNGRIQFISVADIDWIEAEGNYTCLHVGRRVYDIRETLQALMEKLDPREFIRIHRSTIVNMRCIREVQPWFQGSHIVLLQSGEELRCLAISVTPSNASSAKESNFQRKSVSDFHSCCKAQENARIDSVYGSTSVQTY